MSIAGDDLRRRIRNIVAGSGRPAVRLKRLKCRESDGGRELRAAAVDMTSPLEDGSPPWRMVCTSSRPRTQYQEQLARNLVGEVLRMRLEQAHMPLLTILRRMRAHAEILYLASIKPDPWAPPKARVTIPPLARYDLPEFLRQPAREAA